MPMWRDHHGVRHLDPKDKKPWSGGITREHRHVVFPIDCGWSKDFGRFRVFTLGRLGQANVSHENRDGSEAADIGFHFLPPKPGDMYRILPHPLQHTSELLITGVGVEKLISGNFNDEVRS